MALLALAAPTVNLADPQFAAGTTISGIAGTALTGNTGFTVPWVPGLILVIVEGATAPGVVTLVNPVATGPSPAVTLGSGATVAFGPISSEFASAAGLVQVNVTTVTTAAAAAFLLPAATGAKHAPFETNPQATDY